MCHLIGPILHRIILTAFTNVLVSKGKTRRHVDNFRSCISLSRQFHLCFSSRPMSFLDLQNLIIFNAYAKAESRNLMGVTFSIKFCLLILFQSFLWVSYSIILRSGRLFGRYIIILQNKSKWLQTIRNQMSLNLCHLRKPLMVTLML